ncbi:MAG: hypothetical protein R3249_07220 [Nitriliruptorales bacterium]|nr:hypothetical protein [Nitriliruptorales bacterium]
MAFGGEYEHKLDEKFRLTVPADYRDQLADGVVLVRGMDGCIEAFTPDEHERECERAERAGSGRRLQRARQQLLNAGFHLQLDPQGRITLPSPLRDWARIEQKVTVCGNRRSFRVWDPGRWTEYLLDDGMAYARADEELDAGVAVDAASGD